MLDIELYRMSESLARQAVRTWRYAQVHRLDAFEQAGFPVRIGNLGELDQIVGSMHANDRYAVLQDELAGFDDADLERFVSALADFYDFHVSTFRRAEVTVPLAEMIAHLAVYKMVAAYNPGFRSLLEIGPGNGLLAFLLRGHDGLRDYTQIEACESFYLLQGLIDSHLFGPAFDEWARPRGLDGAASCFVGDGAVAVQQLTRKPELNPALPLQVDAVAHHCPWWRIAEVAAERRYDIVTSNANLLEFTPEALNDYAALMRKVVADDGILYVQCFGGRVNGQVSDAVERLYAAGFRALLLVPDGGMLSDDARGRYKRLALGNGVFVTPAHPDYDKAAVQPQANHASDCAAIQRMCFADAGDGRRHYDEGEILDRIATEIARRHGGAKGNARSAA